MIKWGFGDQPPIGGRYHVDIEKVTYGQGSFGDERVIWLDGGPCYDTDCEDEHVWISEREILTA